MHQPEAAPIFQPNAPPSGYTPPSTVGGDSPPPQKKSGYAALLIFLLVVGGIVWAVTWGPFSANAGLQSQMDHVLNEDSRNAVVHMNSYYRSPDVIVVDMQGLTGAGSRADVFRVVLQFAEQVRPKEFRRVEFAFKGETKFFVTGSYFAQLGDEYSYQNPVYTMRTFPSNVYNMDGSHAYSTWTGGILGVLKEETEDFVDFHDRWYWNQMLIEQT
ncbi:hypothetical protein [Methanosphaerula palustris]|nr:hypothetical protein [Methanosphaerula palustris]